MFTNLMSVSDGSKFKVKNGNWTGYVFSRNGEKYIHIDQINQNKKITGKEDLEIIILPQKTSDDLRGVPRMIASDIAWDVDTDDIFDFLSAKPDKEAAAILGIPKSTYAAMNNNRQYEYIHELIQKDESLSVKILGLPDEVEIPVNIVQEAESLDEIGSYIYDTFGYHHGGFDVCFDRPLAEMENMEVPESQQEYFHKLIEFGREEDSLYNEYLNDRNNELELD